MSMVGGMCWSMTKDRILIEGLSARCIIGINHDERRERQDVIIDIGISVDLGKPGRSDNIDDALNYRDVKKQVLGFVERSSFCLIEALAEAIADICLGYDGVEEVRVRVDKPSALRFARTVGVEIVRGKG